MLTCIGVKFTFDYVRLDLSSSVNILKIAGVALRVVFLLFLLCFKPLFRLVPAVVLTLETSEVSAILVLTTKTTLPRPQVFSINDALICRGLHFWRHFLVKHKIRPNLVFSNWLWWIMLVLLANQIGEIFWMNNWINNWWMRLSILWRIMELAEGIILSRP